MDRRMIAAAGGFAVITAVGVWLFLLRGVPSSERGAVRATAEPVGLVASRMVAVGSGSVAARAKDPVGSLWARRSPKDAALHARRKGLERRYRQAGANHQFLDLMVGGDVVGALNELKKQALAGDPAAINLYGDFTYWNCFIHRSPAQLDSYAATQIQESRSLPAADAEWFRDAFVEDIAFDKAVVAACSEAFNVDQAFDMVDERAKQGDSASLRLASMTASKMAERQQLLRAAAVAERRRGLISTLRQAQSRSTARGRRSGSPTR